MKKQGAKTAMPRLRFLEFRDDRGWITRNLGDVAVFSSGGTPSKAEPDYWNGDIPWISASSMYETSIADSDLKVTSLAIGRGTRLAPKGSLLILVRGSMLFNRVPMGIAAVDVAFNQDVKALSVSSEVDAAFLLNQLLAISPRISINETGIGAGKIETDVLTNLPIFVPGTAEQQKIADCLTSLDEVIAAQGRKVEALKAHKRGLMQQLFPREGETRPRLRFPEFRDAPEWEVEPLAYYVASLDAGVSVNSGDRPAGGDEVGVLKTSCVANGVFDSHENKVVQDLSEIERVKEPVRANTILISRMNTIALVGANAFVEKDAPNLFLPDRLWAAKVTPKGHARFLAYVLGSERGRAALSGLASGSSGTMKNIGKAEVLALQIYAPSLPEQQRIADCLASLDTQITAESNRLAALKTHKQGLMQQLFPAPESI